MLLLASEEDYADALRELVLKRIRVPAERLECPREKSAMTPCVARDGSLALAGAACVGCGAKVKDLLDEEILHHPPVGILPKPTSPGE